MPIYKRCSRCGSRIPAGTACNCYDKQHNSDYDRNRRDSRSKSFYNSTTWIRTKDRVLKRDGMDVYVFMTEGRILAADTVHHIVPLRDDWSRRLDVNNLMSLHSSTHSMIEQEYRKDKRKMIEKLSVMLKKYCEMEGQGGV